MFNTVSEEISEDVQHDDLLLPQCLPYTESQTMALYMLLNNNEIEMYVRACMHICEKLIKMGAFF